MRPSSRQIVLTNALVQWPIFSFIGKGSGIFERTDCINHNLQTPTHHQKPERRGSIPGIWTPVVESKVKGATKLSKPNHFENVGLVLLSANIAHATVQYWIQKTVQGKEVLIQRTSLRSKTISAFQSRNVMRLKSVAGMIRLLRQLHSLQVEDHTI
jgi:hypothetical protein